MPEATPRRFTMADLMILIAGCAVAIAATRLYYNETIGSTEKLGSEMWKFRLSYWIAIPAPSLASISLALLICRLRQPRPTLRRLFRQPGTVAISYVLLVLILEGATMLAGRGLNLVFNRIWPPIPSPGVTIDWPDSSVTMLFAAANAGLVIPISWLLLLAVGRWRPEPSWIDRSGRCLGICWIAIDLASSSVLYSYF